MSETSRPEQPPARAYCILLGAQIAIGAAAIFARYALHGAGPIVVSALRLSIAAVPLLAVGLFSANKKSVTRRHEYLFACSGLALAVHFATWIASLLYTSVAVSTLLVCTVPVWTALYDVLFRKQNLGWKFWSAFAAAAFGVALIVFAKAGAVPIPGLAPQGDLLAIAGGVAFAAYLIAIRSISSLYPTTVIVGRTYSWSAVALCTAAAFAHQMPPATNDVLSWGGIAAMALISQMLGHTGMNASLRWFSPNIVAFSTLMEPVIAAVLAALIFAEGLSMQTLCGSVIVLSCVAMILRLPHPAQPQSAIELVEL